jgi:hypothetical protein
MLLSCLPEAWVAVAVGDMMVTMRYSHFSLSTRLVHFRLQAG